MGDAVISFVCWKWRGPDPQRAFEAAHVNVLRAMVGRHYRAAHRFICITDDPKGLDRDIEVCPMPEQTFDGVQSPSGPRFPSCYRRLWMFSREAKRLGERVFCLDVDVVITRDIAPLIEREEDFVGWCDKRFGWDKIAGGCYLLRTGTMSHVWDSFVPTKSPQLAREHGNGGSDQGWMSYVMYPPPGRWGFEDGLIKIGWTTALARHPPPEARIIFTSGLTPPWSDDTQRRYPWITQHWAL